MTETRTDTISDLNTNSAFDNVFARDIPKTNHGYFVKLVASFKNLTSSRNNNVQKQQTHKKQTTTQIKLVTCGWASIDKQTGRIEVFWMGG